MASTNLGSIQKQLAQPGSSLRKYKLSVVGNKGLISLFAYEAIVFATGSLPGEWGSRLRSLCYSFLLQRSGKKMRIGKNCSFKRPHLTVLGDYIRIEDEVALDVKMNGQGIVVSDNCVIGRATIFSCPGGRIIIGKGTKIGVDSRLGSLQGLTIGKDCSIGDFTYIVGAGHATDSLDCPIIEQPLTCKGQNMIGNNVIIGDRVTILDGVIIGDNVYVESGSLVNTDVKANSRVSGVPAREN